MIRKEMQLLRTRRMRIVGVFPHRKIAAQVLRGLLFFIGSGGARHFAHFLIDSHHVPWSKT